MFRKRQVAAEMKESAGLRDKTDGPTVTLIHSKPAAAGGARGGYYC
jgi:hypothetical protein